jgi:hypothetical protein
MEPLRATGEVFSKYKVVAWDGFAPILPAFKVVGVG